MNRLSISAASKFTAAELIAHLIARGLSQRDIAKHLGSTSATISRVATGERKANEALYRDLLAMATSGQKLSKKSKS